MLRYWPQGYRTFFSCSIQLSMEFILLIYVKMPTIVGILTFIGRITTNELYSKKIKSLTSKLKFDLKTTENTFTKMIKN